MDDNIKVSIRARPLLQREKDLGRNCGQYWRLSESQIGLKDGSGRPYNFDRVFDPNQNTDDVYLEMAKPIVESAMSGFNGTIFAYGQTASGKTYTMSGTKDSPGIIPRVFREIFDTIENTPDREFLIRISYLEIYNENVVDLLAPPNQRRNLDVREDMEGCIFVKDLTEEMCKSADDILSHMKRGDMYRHVGQTNMNERSSRSHSIFRMVIESRERADVDLAVNVSQLNLVDLAGSEKAKQTGASGQRLVEGASINKSLTTLGLVISQLSEVASHVSYRDSKLTRILQNSLGGNSKTVIICNITLASLDETQSTLRFATSAKRIKNQPRKNEVLSDQALLKRYQREISLLTQKLAQVTETNQPHVGPDNQLLLNKLAEKEQLEHEHKEKIERLTQLICVSSRSAAPAELEFKKKAKRRQTWCPGKNPFGRGQNPFTLSEGNNDIFPEESFTSETRKTDSISSNFELTTINERDSDVESLVEFEDLVRIDKRASAPLTAECATQCAMPNHDSEPALLTKINELEEELAELKQQGSDVDTNDNNHQREAAELTDKEIALLARIDELEEERDRLQCPRLKILSDSGVQAEVTSPRSDKELALLSRIEELEGQLSDVPSQKKDIISSNMSVQCDVSETVSNQQKELLSRIDELEKQLCKKQSTSCADCSMQCEDLNELEKEVALLTKIEELEEKIETLQKLKVEQKSIDYGIQCDFLKDEDSCHENELRQKISELEENIARLQSNEDVYSSECGIECDAGKECPSEREEMLLTKIEELELQIKSFLSKKDQIAFTECGSQCEPDSNARESVLISRIEELERLVTSHEEKRAGLLDVGIQCDEGLMELKEAEHGLLTRITELEEKLEATQSAEHAAKNTEFGVQCDSFEREASEREKELTVMVSDLERQLRDLQSQKCDVFLKDSEMQCEVQEDLCKMEEQVSLRAHVQELEKELACLHDKREQCEQLTAEKENLSERVCELEQNLRSADRQKCETSECSVQCETFQCETSTQSETSLSDAFVQCGASEAILGVECEKSSTEFGVQCEISVAECSVQCEASVVESGVQYEASVVESGVQCVASVVDSGMQCEASVVESGVQCEAVGSTERELALLAHIDELESLVSNSHQRLSDSSATAETQKELVELSENLSACLREKEGQCTYLQIQNESLSQCVKEVSERCETATEKNQQLEELNETLSQQLTALHTEYEELQTFTRQEKDFINASMLEKETLRHLSSSDTDKDEIIAGLQESITTLNAEMDKMKEERQHLQSDIDQLLSKRSWTTMDQADNGEKNHYMALVASLEAQLQGLQQEHRELTEKHQQQQTQHLHALNEVKSQMCEREEQKLIKQLTADLHSAKEEKGRVQTDLDELLSKRSRTTMGDAELSERNNLRRTNASLQDNLTKLQEEHELMKLAHSDLMKTHDDLKLAYDDLITTKDDLMKAQSELKEPFDDIKAIHDELQVAYDRLKATHNDLNVTHDDFMSEHDELKLAYNDLKGTHNELVVSHNDLKATHENLMALYNGLNTTHEDLKVTHDDLKLAFEDLKVTHDDLKLAFEDLKVTHEDQHETLSLKLAHDELKVAYDDLVVAHDDLKLTHEELKVTHDDLKLAFEDLKVTHEDQHETLSLKLAHDELKVAHDDLVVAHDDLKLTHDELKVTHDELVFARNDLNLEHDELKIANNDLKVACEDLKATHEDLKARHEDLKTTYEDLTTRHEDLKLTYGDLKVAHEDIKVAFEDLQTAHDELKTAHEEQVSLAIDTQDELMDAQEKVYNLEQKVEKLQHCSIQLTPSKAVEQDLSSLHIDCGELDLRFMLAAAEERNMELDEQLSELKKTIQITEEDLQSKDTEIHTLRDEMESLRELCSVKVEEIQRRYDQLESDKRDREVFLSQQCSEHAQRLETESLLHQQELASLKEEHDKLTGELQRKEEEIRSLKEEMEVLNEIHALNIEEQQSKCVRLEAELSVKEGVINESQELHLQQENQSLALYKHECSSLKEEKSMLEDELKIKQGELSAVKEELELIKEVQDTSLKELNSRCEQLEVENDEKESRWQEYCVRKAEDEKHSEEMYQQECKALRTEKDVIEEKLLLSEEEIQSLKEEMYEVHRDYLSRLQDLEMKYEALQSEKKEKELYLHQQYEDLKVKEMSTSDLQAEESKARGQDKANYEDHIHRLTEDIQLLKEELEAVNELHVTQVEELQKKVDDLTFEKNEKEMCLEQMRDEKSDGMRYQSEYEREVSLRQQVTAQFEGALQQKTDKISSLTKQLEALHQTHATEKQQLENKYRELEDEKLREEEFLKKCCDEQQDEERKAWNAFSEAEESLKKEKRVFEEETKKMKDEIERLKDELVSSQPADALKDLQRRYSELEAEKLREEEFLMKCCDEHQEDERKAWNALSAAEDSHSKEKLAFEAEIKKLQEEMTCLKELLSSGTEPTVEGALREMRWKYKQLEAEKQRNEDVLRKRCEEQTQEVQKSHNLHYNEQKARKRDRAKFEAELSERDTEIETLRAKLLENSRQAGSAGPDEVSELRKREADYKQQIYSLEFKINWSKREAEKTLDSYKGEVEYLNKKIEQLKNEIRKHQNNNPNDSVMALGKRPEPRQKTRESEDTLGITGEYAKYVLEGEKKRLTSEVQRLTDKCRKLRDALQSEQKTHNETKERLTSLESEVTKLKEVSKVTETVERPAMKNVVNSPAREAFPGAPNRGDMARQLWQTSEGARYFLSPNKDVSSDTRSESAGECKTQ